MTPRRIGKYRYQLYKWDSLGKHSGTSYSYNYKCTIVVYSLLMITIALMEGKNKPQRVEAKHVERGIQKYQGVKDVELNRFIGNAGLRYEAYTFNDGRVLLVLPNALGGMLYNSKQDVYDILEF